MRKIVTILMGLMALSGAGAQLRAQPAGKPGTALDPVKLEAAVKIDPHDLKAREALLYYYFTARMDAAAAIPARRRHILWVIENAPDQSLAYGPTMTIDPAGHSLADPEGFRLASAAWKAQVAKPGAKAMTLANAAYFFKTGDEAFTIGLLKRALGLEPNSREIAARLGDEYALVILGVTMINRSDYPVRNDEALTGSSLAKQCRQELAASRNPYTLAKAGYQILWQGSVLYFSRQLPFDPEPLAKTALDRAVSLAPHDPDVAGLRAEYDKFHKMRQTGSAYEPGTPARASGSAGAKPVASHPSPAPAPASPAALATPRADAAPGAATRLVAAPPTPAPAPPAEVPAAELKKMTAGMSRAEVLKAGAPSSRITMDDDGHLVEIYSYSVQGSPAGTIHLRDGVVVSVRVP